MFAFNDDQFKEGKKKLGIKSNADLIGIGAGGFIRKADREAFNDLLKKLDREIKDQIEADPDGMNFVKDMFETELANHEFMYTRELTDTLDACGLSFDDVIANPKLLAGLNAAIQSYMEWDGTPVYTMQNWHDDGDFKAKAAQEITQEVYNTLYNELPPRALPDHIYHWAFDVLGTILTGGFMMSEPAGANYLGNTYMCFGSAAGKYWYLGEFNEL